MYLMSVYLSNVCLSVCPSIYLCIYLSIYVTLYLLCKRNTANCGLVSLCVVNLLAVSPLVALGESDTG